MVGLALLLTAAGLMGATGVVLAAIAAHGAQTAGLASAAHMLLLHAAAMLGTASLAGQGRLWPPAALLALVGWLAGSLLFSGDIALRVFSGNRLFPLAAPTGGTIMIVAWLAVAAAAALARPNSRPR
ncbi:MAG: DUF423 domain-containing protein [Hyphomicrobiaceae bacterium]|nr:DUF423 domain-containing protein [Hyphomicrobiaceae bacterium]